MGKECSCLFILFHSHLFDLPFCSALASSTDSDVRHYPRGGDAAFPQSGRANEDGEEVAEPLNVK